MLGSEMPAEKAGAMVAGRERVLETVHSYNVPRDE